MAPLQAWHSNYITFSPQRAQFAAESVFEYVLCLAKLGGNRFVDLLRCNIAPG